MTANELWGNTEIICEHTFLITLKIHILLCFQIFPLRKTLFLIRAIFIQGAFKNIQGLLGKIQGLFKDIPQISNFQGLFKDMMIFQGLFKARANHVNDCYLSTNSPVDAIGTRSSYVKKSGLRN